MIRRIAPLTLVCAALLLLGFQTVRDRPTTPGSAPSRGAESGGGQKRSLHKKLEHRFNETGRPLSNADVITIGDVSRGIPQPRRFKGQKLLGYTCPTVVVNRYETWQNTDPKLAYKVLQGWNAHEMTRFALVRDEIVGRGTNTPGGDLDSSFYVFDARSPKGRELARLTALSFRDIGYDGIFVDNFKFAPFRKRRDAADVAGGNGGSFFERTPAGIERGFDEVAHRDALAAAIRAMRSAWPEAWIAVNTGDPFRWDRGDKQIVDLDAGVKWMAELGIDAIELENVDRFYPKYEKTIMVYIIESGRRWLATGRSLQLTFVKETPAARMVIDALDSERTYVEIREP